MPKKKYTFFNIGDLVKVKRRIISFQRGRNGKVIMPPGKIDAGSKVIYLGAKVCHGSTGEWQITTDGLYTQERPVTIKVMFDGSIWYHKVPKGSVYAVFKLIQKVHT
jgi:hypothetical protein